MQNNNLKIVSASVSDRGLSEKRPENEDSFIEIPKSGIFAVADGVGGAQAGDVASQMAMEIVGEAFTNMASPGDAEDIMKRSIERANEAIFQMSNELPQLSTMATTVVALHVNGGIATIGHVGDSRLYRIDSNGSLYRETQDHSVVEEEVRAGRMTPEQAANHPSRNIISRALGAEPSVEVDLKTIMFEPNTTFLICSDGITRHISDDEINALLFSAHQPSEICRRMKEICYDRGAEDNLTAVIVRILEAEAIIENDKEDFEQDTVATARPAVASTGFSDSQDFETQKLDPQFVPVQAEQPNTEYVETAKNDATIDDRNRGKISYDDEKSSSGGFFGKLLGGLLLLILGIGLGAYGYKYLVKQQVVEDAPIVDNVPPQANIESTSFQDTIQDADEYPDRTIFALQNIGNKSPEEFYTLGRAQMLTRNYAEAKKNFTEAKNRLSSADKENVKILTTEIAMGLAIINNQNALREFEKEFPQAQTENSNTDSNVNTSPISPANSQVQ